MYADSNRDKINMIGACLILYYDINGDKAAKRMTIANSNINEKSKSTPSNTNFSRIYESDDIYNVQNILSSLLIN